MEPSGAAFFAWIRSRPNLAGAGVGFGASDFRSRSRPKKVAAPRNTGLTETLLAIYCPIKKNFESQKMNHRGQNSNVVKNKCKALCDEKLCQIERNGRKLGHVELRISVIRYIF